MTINPTLMKAILSMDAYNRGYDAGIKFGNLSGNNSIDTASVTIGNATVITSSGILIEAGNRLDDDIGFYAIAYTYNGEKVISYRGTDDFNGPLDLLTSKDVHHGWTMGGGNTASEQARMAVEFYQIIAGAGNWRTANVSLTGHSLGGGLAGYIGELYDQDATIFDSMTFQLAASNTANYRVTLWDGTTNFIYENIIPSAVAGYKPPAGWTVTEINPIASAELRTLVYGGANPLDTDLNGIKGHYLVGEVLDKMLPLRSGVAELNPYTLEYNTALSSTDLHSIATLAIRMYADPSMGTNVGTDWRKSAGYFWPVLYDNDFSDAVVQDRVSGALSDKGDYAGILREVIAYSAIDEGTKVFGDTGIKAFYHDANELGKVASTDPVLTPSAIKIYSKEISQSFVQYAGELALNKVSLSGTNAAVLNGVLTVNAAGHTLSINFSDTVWKAAGLKAESDGTLSIVSRDDLANKILGEPDTGSPVRYYMSELWGSEANSVIDRVAFALNDYGLTTFSTNPNASAGHAGLLVGGSKDGNLVGSAGDEIIVGGDGTNTLKGGGGTDLIIGGSGDNVFEVSNGHSILGGQIGSGVNTLDLSDYADKITITSGSFNTEGSTAYGNFYGMDIIKLGTGDNSISAAGYAYETVTIYADDGDDTVRFFGTANTDALIADGTITLNYGSGVDGVGTTRVLDAEKIASEGGLITIRELGHSFEGSKSVYDYSGMAQKLTLTATTTADGMSVTDGVKTDTIALTRGTSGIVGSNLGDTVNLATSATTLWLGHGNDIVNLAAGAKGTLIYTGGNDIFNMTGHSFLGTVQLWRDVSNAATFTRTALAWGLNADGNMQSEFNMTMNIPGSGSIVFNKAGIQYNNAGADRLFFTADDIISYGINLNISTWDGLRYDLSKVKPILTGTISDPGSIPTPYDDNLTAVFSEPDHAMNGGSGNDILTTDMSEVWMYGGSGHDTLYANGSYDHLYGGFDDDTLYGGNEFTTLSGDDGNDKLYAQFGNNNLYGGDGDDAYILSGGTDNWINDEISRDGDNNTIEFADLTKSEITWRFLQGTDFVEFQAADGFYLSINDYHNFTTAKFSNGETISLQDWVGSRHYTSDDSDFINASAETSSVTIHLMGGKDYFTGSAYADTVYGDDGNDYIWANAGNDIVNGGAGTDTVMFSDDPAGVIVNLALGKVTDGWGNTDTLISIESAQGSAFNDIFVNSSVHNFFVGNGGIDTVSYDSAAAGVTINLATQKVTGEGADTLSAISNAIGSKFNDTFISSKGDNVFTGNGGIDTVSYASATTGVTVNLAAGTATGDGADTIKGISNAVGSTRNDTFISSNGNNVFTGNGGTDTVSYAFAATGVTANLTKGTVTGDGTDTLKAILNIIGSAHNDIFVSSAGNNVFNGGAGIDMLSYAGTASAVTVSLALTGAQATGGSGTDTVSGIENLIGSSFNDKLTGSSGNNIIEGGAGNDILNGGAGTDTLSYSSAASAITVSLALTTAQVTGGAGTDTVSAFENLIGSAFNDKLTGSSGNNTIEGGAGNDTLNGGAGTDTLSYASATSAITINLALTTAQITGGAGTDTVSAFENLNGSGFNDKLTGNTGVNTIHGGAGVDTIDGGVGNDILYGDAGADILTGGAGLDRFVFDTSLSGSDTIKDFNKAEDTLDLSNLLTAYDPLTDAITQFVQISNSGANSIVKVDLDGAANGQVWTQIATMTGVTGLTDEQALLNSGHLMG
jgi:Ca2+-binding RTX toxin-like protein